MTRLHHPLTVLCVGRDTTTGQNAKENEVVLEYGKNGHEDGWMDKERRKKKKGTVNYNFREKKIYDNYKIEIIYKRESTFLSVDINL